MDTRLLKDGLGWGIGLWLIGYVLGIGLFFVVPLELIGWVLTPIGVVITLWVLLKKIAVVSFQHFVWVAVIWTVVAIVFDYIFLVQLLQPEDGYYKFDIYVYYMLTLALPLLVGWWKTRRRGGELRGTL